MATEYLISRPNYSVVIDGIYTRKREVKIPSSSQMTADLVYTTEAGVRMALVVFDAFEDSGSGNSLYREIVDVAVKAYFSFSRAWEDSGSYSNNLLLKQPIAPEDELTVTWETHGETIQIGALTVQTPGGSQYVEYSITDPSAIRRLLSNPQFYFGLQSKISSSYTPNFLIYIQQSWNVDTCIRVGRSDDLVSSAIVSVNSPMSGYISRATAQTFSFKLEPDGVCLGDFSFAQGSYFYWRAGASGSWTQVALTRSGDSATVTISANTFPVDSTIQWYAAGIDNLGNTSETQVYTLSTTDTNMIATPLSPISSIESTDGEIIFRWNVTSDSGSAQSAAQLQYSDDGSNWSSLATVQGAAKSYTAPANTFSVGTVYWRLRVYNADSSPGPWSSAASFIAFGAPVVSTITTDSKPFSTFNWQADGQMAYELIIDDSITYGPFFGEEKTFTLDDYLADGEHTAKVRVQNEYGLWSSWTSVLFTVQNMTGLSAPTLSVAFGIDAVLTIRCNTSRNVSSLFLVYRDGKKIGQVTVPAGSRDAVFSDRSVLGGHSYYVLQLLNTYPHYYIKSESKSGSLAVTGTQISALSGGEWIELRKTKKAQSENQFSRTRTVSYRYIMGAKYPFAEIGSHEEFQGSFDVAWLLSESESISAFEELLGQCVIVKHRNGKVLIGILDSWEEQSAKHHVSYSFNIRQIHWGDYINADT